MIVCVLNDGETWSGVPGCVIADIPDEFATDPDSIEDCMVNHWDKLDSMPLGPIDDQDTIFKFFRIFFPNMVIGEVDGEVVISTGVKANA